MKPPLSMKLFVLFIFCSFISLSFSEIENLEIQQSSNATENRLYGVWLGVGIPVVSLVFLASFVFWVIGCVLLTKILFECCKIVRPLTNRSVEQEGGGRRRLTREERIELFLNQFFLTSQEISHSKGASKTVIEDSTEIILSLEDDKIDNPDYSCIICTETFGKDEVVRKLSCGHIFHRDCIDQWLINYNASCPTCRKPIVEEKEEEKKKEEEEKKEEENENSNRSHPNIITQIILERQNESSELIQQQEEEPVYYKALFDYPAENDFELSLEEGEKIQFLSNSRTPNWLRGKNRFGRTGIFPKSFVELWKDE